MLIISSMFNSSNNNNNAYGGTCYEHVNTWNSLQVPFRPEIFQAILASMLVVLKATRIIDFKTNNNNNNNNEERRRSMKGKYEDYSWVSC